MDQPSLQTSKPYIGIRRTAIRARQLCPLFEFSTGQTGGPGRDFGIRVAGPGQKDFGGLPACQTILNAIGDLLAYGRQVKKLLFAENIFGFVGKSPIHRRLVPKVVIPIHVRHCA